MGIQWNFFLRYRLSGTAHAAFSIWPVKKQDETLEHSRIVHQGAPTVQGGGLLPPGFSGE
jgi:hypothetical protein